MPQGPIPVTNTPLCKKVMNITTATVVKATAGRVYKVVVVVAGTGAGSLNDVASTGGAVAANEVAGLPNVVGPLDLNVPFSNGITVTPGSGQTIAIFYN